MIKFHKIKTDHRNFLHRVKEFFRQTPEIVLAYIFGSYAKDNPQPLSDFDIAVLIEEIKQEKLGSKRLELLSQIMDILHTDEVDLVMLNYAPLTLQFEIIKNGKLLYRTGEAKRIEYEIEVVNKFLDTTTIRKEYFRYLRMAIKQGKMREGYEKY